MNTGLNLRIPSLWIILYREKKTWNRGLVRQCCVWFINIHARTH